jgi:hypothetical protein
MRKNHPKNQHYVPRFLLKYFSTNNQVFCYDKKRDLSFNVSIDKIANESWFFDIYKRNPTNSLEYKLQEIEGPCSNIIQRIIDEETIRILTDDEKELISLFLIVQEFRTRNYREVLKSINEQRIVWLRNHGFRDDQMKNLIENNTEESAKKAQLYGLATCEDMIPYLLNKKWFLFRSKNEFYISDNPFAMQNTIKRNEDIKIGLEVEGIEIYFPLSSSIALGLFCNRSFDKLEKAYNKYYKKILENGQYNYQNFINCIKRKIPLDCSEKDVLGLNSLQIKYSERFVFSSNNEISKIKDFLSHHYEYKIGPRVSLG